MSSNLLTALTQADSNPKAHWQQHILCYSSSDEESVDSTTTSPIKECKPDLVKANTSSESIEEDVLLVDESISLQEKQDNGAKHNSTCLSDLHRNPTELRMSTFGRIPKIFTNITSLNNMKSIEDTPMENSSPLNVGRGVGRGVNRGSIRSRGKPRGRIYRGNITGLNLSRTNLPEVYSPNEAGPALNGRIWKHADVLNRDKLTRPPLHPDVGDKDNKASFLNKTNTLRLPIRHPDNSTKDSGEQTVFIMVTTSPLNTCDVRTISLTGHSVNSSTTKEEIHQMEPKMAVCPYCRAQSINFQKCDVCHKVLPAQIKTSLSSNETQSNKRPAFTGYVEKTIYQDNVTQQISEFLENNDDDDEVSFNKERIRNTWIKHNEEDRTRRYKGNPIIEPPVCLTISSDEEEGNEQQITQRMQTEVLQPRLELTFNSPNLQVEEQCIVNQRRQLEEMEETPTRREKMRDKIEEKSQFMDMAESIKDGSIIGQNNLKSCSTKEKRLANFLIADDVKEVELICRSVRIGSYKTAQDQMITFNRQGITIYVKAIESQDLVKVHIPASDIIMVLASFCKRMPCLFVYVTPNSGLVVRERLKMNSKKGPYFDPKSAEECHKRIVVLPDQITDDQGFDLRAIFDEIYKVEKRAVVILHEIESSRANILLVKSKPPDLPGSPLPIDRSNLIISNIGSSISSPADKPNLVLRSSPSPFKNITKLLVYPPPPQTGGITITSEDFNCLEDGEFLNDVIIDFYLKYLVLHKLSEEDRNRTHLLSSFFYRRLTQKPVRQYNSFEDDPTLTAQQKRHTRVKTWTRHVDLFEKDFIIVPINESAHWFLAIICYPGLLEPVYDDKPDTADSSKTQPEESTQENQSQPTEQDDDDDDDDEEEEDEEEYEAAAAIAENEEVSMESSVFPEMNSQAEEPVTSSTEALPATPVEATTPITPTKPAVPNPRWQKPGCKKQPCILIFDSLAGPGRALIVKALREYLSVEWDLKKKVSRLFNKDTMKGANPRVPQQNNYSDCGVYLLQYAETFFQTPIKDYAIPIRGLQSWFSLDKVKSKRSEIQQLILRLQQEQLVSLHEQAKRTTS